MKNLSFDNENEMLIFGGGIEKCSLLSKKVFKSLSQGSRSVYKKCDS